MNNAELFDLVLPPREYLESLEPGDARWVMSCLLTMAQAEEWANGAAERVQRTNHEFAVASRHYARLVCKPRADAAVFASNAAYYAYLAASEAGYGTQEHHHQIEDFLSLWLPTRTDTL